ncbi:hypothetical protein JCM8097_004372 [Rhodosporidiobolus ruineniae]
MPRASTSKATIQPSDPTAAPSRRRSTRARSELDADFDQHDDTYEPRQGQLRRRGTKRTRRGAAAAGASGGSGDEGKRKKRAKKDDRDDGDKDAKADKRARKRRESKGKGKAVDQDEAARGQEQQDPPARKSKAALKPVGGRTDASSTERTLRKKRVRIAAPLPALGSSDDEQAGRRRGDSSADDSADDYHPPAAASSSDGETAEKERGTRRAADGSARTGGASAVDDPLLHFDEPDLSLPSSIPLNAARSTARYWRSLEYGVYRTALHDVARERCELGPVLVEWEGLRRRREAEERAETGDEEDRLEEGAQPDEDEALQDVQPDASSSSAIQQKPPRPTAAIDSSDDGDNYLPSDVASPPPNQARSRPRPRQRKKLPRAPHSAASASPAVLPLPSSLNLASVARWPVPLPTGAVYYEAETEADGTELEEMLREVAESEQDRLRRAGVALPPPMPEEGAGGQKTKRARSAYGPGGPLEAWVGSPRAGSPAPSSSSASSDDDADLETAPLSSPPLSSLDLRASTLSRLSALPSLLNTLLLRLLDFIPKSPLPAFDYWSAQDRAAYLKKEDGKRGIRREEGRPGWQEVVAVAREMDGVPDHIVNKLEEQLVALFGPSARGPIALPPPGGDPFPAPYSAPRRRRKAKKEEDEGDADSESDGGAPKRMAAKAAIGGKGKEVVREGGEGGAAVTADGLDFPNGFTPLPLPSFSSSSQGIASTSSAAHSAFALPADHSSVTSSTSATAAPAHVPPPLPSVFLNPATDATAHLGGEGDELPVPPPQGS